MMKMTIKRVVTAAVAVVVAVIVIGLGLGLGLLLRSQLNANGLDFLLEKMTYFRYFEW